MHRAVRLVVDTGYIVKDGQRTNAVNFQWKMRPKVKRNYPEIERYMAFLDKLYHYKMVN
jgi:uncharacterized protein (DUF885 family)